MKTVALMILCLACPALILGIGELQTYGNLKIITANIWSGSDYQGSFSFGKWESDAARESRYQLLVDQLRAENADLILLQEVNPVRRLSKRLARDLNLDEVHQVCIAGIKVLGLGIPKGFQEGNAILAKPELKLRKIEDWKLSGGPGCYSDNFSFHLDETVSALLAQVIYDNHPLNLLNVHLSAYPDSSRALADSLNTLAIRQSLTAKELDQLHKKWTKGSQRRDREARLLLKKLKDLDQKIPLILGGDFNAVPDSPLMSLILRKGQFIDSSVDKPEAVTWDPKRNSNTRFARSNQDARGNPNTPWEDFNAMASGFPRKLDYLLLSRSFEPEDVLGVGTVLDQPVKGSFASDHYGLLAELQMQRVLESSPRLFERIPPEGKFRWSALPIVMYDTDTGFGYGLKGFVFNLFKANESLDLILFNSTGGERWYKLEMSLPDKELRLGKKFGLAWDLKLDYDKWIKASFYGLGADSQLSDEENYTKELFDVSIIASHPYSRFLTGQLGVRARNMDFSNYAPTGNLAQILNTQYDKGERSGVHYFSNLLSLNWDNRDSVVNPGRGFLINHTLETDIVESIINGLIEFSSFNGLKASSSAGNKEPLYNYETMLLRNTSTIQYYTVLCYPRTVLALRGLCQFQPKIGDGLPAQTLLSLGGGTTLRGSPMDRYLDNAILAANAELRFPIWKGFGGVLGFDLGQAASSLGKLNNGNWIYNPVLGLRFYMKDIIVRADLGFGKESTGFYFNFGQAW